MKYIEASQLAAQKFYNSRRSRLHKRARVRCWSNQSGRSQLFRYNRTHRLLSSDPASSVAPGFEIAGVLAEVGSGVDGFKVGDPVAAITLAGGGYATHVVIPAVTAIPLPRDLDPVLGAAILVQGLTALLVLEEAKVKAGHTVLVSAAAGGVGSIAVQIAKAKGARVMVLRQDRSSSS